MASESVSTKLNTISATLDGLCGVVSSIIESGETEYAHRVAIVASELLERLNGELSELAMQVSKMEGASS